MHDQGWKERDIFGKIRFMSYAGCSKKFKIADYVKRVDKLVAAVRSQPGIATAAGNPGGFLPPALAADRVTDADGDVCKRRRRQLEAVPQAAPTDEAAWYAEWRQRLGCWWLALPGPTQAQLGHCLGALSLHLSSRLEGLLGRPVMRDFAPHTQAQCEWLEGSLEQLQLPHFPTSDGFSFSVPAIPKLLPPWEQLHSSSRLSPRGTHGPHPERYSSDTWMPMMIGAGAGGAAFAIASAVLLFSGWPRRNKASSVPLRACTSAASSRDQGAQTACHPNADDARRQTTAALDSD